jgi:Porin subfamily
MRLRDAVIAGVALIVSGQAQAIEPRQIPAAPKPVPCPSKGSGFVRMPGSDSCIRVSGRVVAGMDGRAGHGPAAAPLVAGRLAIDNRADTELGEVRTYVRIGNGRR